MPLPESRRFPREYPSFIRNVGRQLVHLLTAGVIAVVLAALAIYQVLDPLELGWGACIVLLVILWAQYRAGKETVHNLQNISNHIYRRFPHLDEGIEIKHMKWTDRGTLPIPLKIVVPPDEDYLLVQGNEAFTVTAALPGGTYDPKTGGTNTVHLDVIHQFMEIAYIKTSPVPSNGRLDLRISANRESFFVRTIEWASAEEASH